MKNMLNNFKRFQFLMIQMVARDFKIKYKRSVLGILWSVLNPLLMSFVMYFVFSKVFGRGDRNFILYLLIGQVLFSYFSEASNFGMMSIVNNFALITKIYIPKYIFPLSKCLFAAINLLVSFIPMLFFVIILRRPITINYLYIPIILASLFIFAFGVALLMSTASVFLRDIYHLYGIVILVLNYFTPIFWTMTDLQVQGTIAETILKINPLFHYITGIRDIMIEGLAPDIVGLVYGALWAIGIFIVGAFVFKKNQDKFIYYV